MLTLDQVQKLEQKVEKAVSLIKALQRDKEDLENKLSRSISRISELEGVINSFKQDQNRIEEGILSALSRLSEFEDAAVAGGIPSEKTISPDTGITQDSGPGEQDQEPVLETGVDLDFEDSLEEEQPEPGFSPREKKDSGFEGQLEIF